MRASRVTGSGDREEWRKSEGEKRWGGEKIKCEQETGGSETEWEGAMKGENKVWDERGDCNKGREEQGGLDRAV